MTAMKEKKNNLKRKKPSNKAAALEFDDDAPAFPRGGRGLSREEKEKIHVEVDAEFYAGLRGSRNKKKKMVNGKAKSRKSSGNDGADGNEEDLGSLFGDGITGKLPQFANRITMKNVSAGMKLWGVIVEVNEKDIVISLPGGLRGLVRADEAVDAVVDMNDEDAEDSFLSSLFHVGQLVSCIVLQVDEDKTEMGKRKAWLSLRLSLLYKGFSLEIVEEGMVLTAYVKSIEDHGYLLHFGLPSFTGFLPKNSQDGKEMKLNAGQLVQGIVKSIDKARKVVHLCSDADVVSKCVTKDLKGISLDLLIPGMMVNARVNAVLSNGIMLSFLTYFTGTVDVFHLKELFPSSDWMKEYGKNKKVNARLLFIDPSTRAIGLTMNPHLLQNTAPPQILKAGESYDQSQIIRIDKRSGLLLRIPCEPFPAPAYVAISDVADKEIHKLETKFKEGGLVRARILGYRHLEGLAMGILKASAFKGSVFTHSDVKPGMVVKAKVIAVKSVGAFLQFPGGVKALCPLQHMSESEISKPRKKFQVGAELVFRVLGCKSKRITVTHKRTLVKSKLKILASYSDATEGLLTHGWITKIEDHGCFVRFYNGVQGFVPRSELGLEPGCDPVSRYHVGEVVKCRITSSVPAHRRINLSFIVTPSRDSDDDLVKPGNLVSGTVEHVTSCSVFLHVDVKGNMKGTISIEHLADHQGHATAMKLVLKPGYKLPELLILDVEGNNLVLTAKYSLIHARQQLPSDPSQMSPQSLIHGYICNIIETGCFIRFLGRLTGFCPRRKAIDDQKVDISKAFYIGQSVRCNVLDADSESGRITLSLKQSSCSSKDASFLQSYFLTEEKIAELQLLDSSSSEETWAENFNIGCIVDGKIQKAKDVGVVVSFEGCTSVFGFITQYQLGGKTVDVGSSVRAMVLDISKAERLVDLSLKLEFVERLAKNDSEVQSSKKKRKKVSPKDLKVHATVNAIVETVKEEYLVLSLPDHDYAIGYAAVSDYNIQNLTHGQFSSGQSVVATIMSLPSPSTAGRLLLFLESTQPAEASSSKRSKRKSGYDVGALVEAEITEIKTLELRLKFGNGLRGRVHITEVADVDPDGNPFSCYKVGQKLAARILANYTPLDSHKKGYQWELSIKPSVLAGTTGTQDDSTKELNYAVGQRVSGYVYKVDNDWVWLAVSRHVNAQLFVLDSSSELDELQEFSRRFKLGDILSGYILNINADKRLLRLVMHKFPTTTNGVASEDHKNSGLGTEKSSEKVVLHIHEGDLVGGRIWKILPGVGGLLVQLGPHLSGKVHFTEISDTWVPNPLSSYQEGQFVKCKVLEVSNSLSGTVHVDLSLRSTLEGLQSGTSGAILKGCTAGYLAVKIEDLHPNMAVKGYVKNVSSKGCFIMLARNIDAKVLLGNLSDGFVKDPVKEFPVGKLVEGKVLSVDPSSKRVEVTLKTSDNTSGVQSKIVDLSSVHVGDVMSGTIKRVEPYGLFIRLDDTNIVGLCHVSELSDDDHVSGADKQHKAGERVRAKVLKVDKERQRIALGMKASYFNYSPEESDEPINGSTGNVLLDSQDVPSLASDSDTECEVELESSNVHSTLGSSVPPLEVQLDDADDSVMDSVANLKVADDVDAGNEKRSRQEKRKAREEREREIRAAEERLLEGDIPRTSDEFEKLIRSSPNNSFVWIKYMSFKLDSADVEGARSVAERALETINMTHEAEKLNIWVAYLNLENEFGNHREEAVKGIFRRALQFCDPMKIHMELLGLYERTCQNELAGELLEIMVKKFRNSMEVWLRRAQFLLNQNQEGVETITNRALLSLPRQDHIKFLTQVAILEFKCGVPDRGRSIFEKILREFPRRRDLWSVYIDQEIRVGDVDLTRSLFERATSLSLPTKKMKFLFKKYLNYEKSLGDEERVQYVVQKAREYIESTNT